jgi:RNA polymerase sigma factor (TIGR02999 family)
MESSRERVTLMLLEAGREGVPSRQVIDRLVPLVYDELRRMAHAQLAREGRRLTLDTTGLVHEAYCKLVDGDRAPVSSRGHFFGAAARAMRQVLVDAARRRRRAKRGGGEVALELDEQTLGVDAYAGEVLVLHDALDRLAAAHPRPARVVECRCFGGLSVAETCEALDVARRTVDRDWTFARAWLRRALGAERPAAAG